MSILAAAVEPEDPLERREPDLIKVHPGSPRTDPLGLEEADHRLDEVVVAVAARADRGGGAQT